MTDPNDNRCRHLYQALGDDGLCTICRATGGIHPKAIPVPSPILKYFASAHLSAKLQEISRPFGELAEHLDRTLADGPEKSAGLRKLLEAKDCAVRAALG